MVPCGGGNFEVQLKSSGIELHSILSSECTEAGTSKVSEWKLRYPVFHFECADMDADGVKDILVGVVKATKYDSVKRKRIFIFKLLDGYIRPMWLGSRVSQPLEDFRVVAGSNGQVVRTIEIEQNGNYLVAEYTWKEFGLTFVRYVLRNSTLPTAQNTLML
jgi:hypothetical protein